MTACELMCPECGTRFTPARGRWVNQKFCSRRCQNRVYNRVSVVRRRELIHAARRLQVELPARAHFVADLTDIEIASLPPALLARRRSTP